MKKLLLTTLGFFIGIFILSAQNWTDKLDKARLQKGELTLSDYEKAFDDFWEPYHVVNGYYYLNGEKMKAPGWKQFKRWVWKVEGMVDGEGRLPETTVANEIEKYKRNSSRDERSLSGSWTNIGYNTSNGGYQGIGRINCIAFHPSDNNTFWVGTPSGGLWVTTDGGTNWSVLTDNNPTLGVSAIAVTSDYATSQTIYIGTGDRDGGSAWTLGGGNSNDDAGVGVLKSTDGGATWSSSLSFNLSNQIVIYDLLINPSDNNNLIAATGDGIYETVNAGTSWTQITTNVCTDLEYKPGSTTVFYGAFINGKYIITFTKSSGWGWVTATLPGSSSKRTELAVSMDDPNIVYALTVNSSDGLEGVYKSTNAGVSYTLVFDGSVSGNNIMGGNCDGSTSSGQGTYDIFITANPNNANEVYVGGINVWKTNDGGNTWTIKTHWSGTCGGAAQTVHADQHCCEFQNSSTIFIGNDGGIYKSTDNGSTWVDITNGLTINQIYRIGVSQSSSSDIIIGLQDNGTHVHGSSGWLINGVIGGDGMECLINPTNVNNQFGEYINGDIRRTANHWSSQTYVRDLIRTASGNSNLSGAWITPYMLDPNNSNTLFVAYDELWKSTDQGTSSGNFTQISNFPTSGTIRSLRVAPSNSNYIYAGFLKTLWKTNNGGSSWTDITSGLPVSSGNITYICVKKDDPETMWVTIGGFNNNAVYETTNGGATWVNISTGLPQIPAMSIVQNANNTNKVELYVAMMQGVYMKMGTADWVPFTSGLPNVFCTELEIFYDNETPLNSKIRVGTFGRGLWESGLPIVEFSASNQLPESSSETVTFTDLSTNSPSSWNWSFDPATVTFVGGTSASSQNPQVQFNNPGAYTVTLTTNNTFGDDLKTKTAYIHMGLPGLWTGQTGTDWATTTNWHNHLVPVSSNNVTINDGPANWPVYTGDLTIGTQCGTISLSGNAEITVTGNLEIPAGKLISCTGSPSLNIGGNFKNYGTFTPGNSIVKMTGNSDAEVTGNLINNGNKATPYSGAYVYPGAYFNVVASGGKQISIDGFALNCNTTGTVNVQVWYKVGSYVGSTSTPGNWTQLGTTQTVTGQGNGNPTPVNPGQSITIPAGSTYGFYINCYSGTTGYLRFSAGANSYSNTDITINTGKMTSQIPPGSGVFSGDYTFSGTVYYSYVTSNALSFYDFDIDKSNALVTNDGVLNIGNNLSISASSDFTNKIGSSINVTGNVSLNADATGSASFIDNGTTTYGNASVESYISQDQWHMVSAPINNAFSEIFTNLYLMYFDETDYSWHYITALDYDLTEGHGFMAWSASSSTGNATVNYSGNLNTENISLSNFSYTESQPLANRGWNMVGNPYPSSINWNSNWARVNVDATAYIYDGANYLTWNVAGSGTHPNGDLAPGQGFWIKANASGASLTIPKSERKHSAQQFYKTSDSQPNELLISVDGNGYSDKIIIGFNEGTTAGFDNEFDAWKIDGIIAAPQLYSVYEDNKLTVNMLPAEGEDMLIPIHCKVGKDTLYKITVTGIENLELYENIWLEDLREDEMIDLKEVQIYNFTANPADNPDRFLLRFNKITTGASPAMEELSKIKIYAFEKYVTVVVPPQAKGDIAIYNMLGQKIAFIPINGTVNRVQLKNSSFYVVSVSTEDGNTVKKISIR